MSRVTRWEVRIDEHRIGADGRPVPPRRVRKTYKTRAAAEGAGRFMVAGTSSTFQIVAVTARKSPPRDDLLRVALRAAYIATLTGNDPQ